MDAENAAIKAVPVEIKVLRINQEQVTEALYKQIAPGFIVDPDKAVLIGQPWGKVNYFGDCADDAHVNVLWQFGGKLLRSCVYPRPDHGPYLKIVERHTDLAWDLSLLAAYSFAASEDPVIDKQARKVTFSGIELQVPTTAEHDHWMNPYFWKQRQPSETWRRQVYERAALSVQASPPEVVRKRDALQRYYDAWVTRYTECYDEVAALEQIFILF